MILFVCAFNKNVGKGFHVCFTLATPWTMSHYSHFVAHASTLRYSHQQFVLKLDKFMVVSSSDKSFIKYNYPINIICNFKAE